LEGAGKEDREGQVLGGRWAWSKYII
jgi:hypothetical protein